MRQQTALALAVAGLTALFCVKRTAFSATDACFPQTSDETVLQVLRSGQAAIRGGTVAVTQPLPPVNFVLNPRLLGLPLTGPHNVPEHFFKVFLLPHIQPGSLIIDVGSNTGQFAITMAQAGLDGVCFEPAPETCEKLRANVESARVAATSQSRTRRYGQLVIQCAAVGAQTGSMRFAMKQQNATASGAALTSASFHLVRDDQVQGKSTTSIPIVTVDGAIPPAMAGRDIVLLKTDTQGYEEGVLRGAHHLLQARRVRFLIVECSPYLLESSRSRTKPVALMQLIASYGYACTTLAFFQPYLRRRDRHTAPFVVLDRVGLEPPDKTGHRYCRELPEKVFIKRGIRPPAPRVVWRATNESAAVHISKAKWRALGIHSLCPGDYVKLSDGAYYAVSESKSSYFDRAVVREGVIEERAHSMKWERAYMNSDPIPFPADPSPQCASRPAASMRFDELDGVLRHIPHEKRSGWTDLFCWRT
jgi:FkbM family methyltransferase